jgi:hypothetical protein
MAAAGFLSNSCQGLPSESLPCLKDRGSTASLHPLVELSLANEGVEPIVGVIVRDLNKQGRSEVNRAFIGKSRDLQGTRCPAPEKAFENDSQESCVSR